MLKVFLLGTHRYCTGFNNINLLIIELKIFMKKCRVPGEETNLEVIFNFFLNLSFLLRKNCKIF